MFRPLILLTPVISYASALAFPGPQQTSVAELGDLVFPPEPTAGPVYHEILKRSTNTVLLAPDNTCGYFSGLPGAAYTCGPSDVCAFFLGSSKTSGLVNCCDSNFDCNARVTCVDRLAYLSSSACDNGCVKDTFTLKCTQATAPYCNGITFPNENVQDYFCDNTAVKTWQTALTNYNGYQGNHVFSSVTVSDTPTSTSGATTKAASLASVSTTSTSASGSTTPVPVPASSGSSTPVGAIVGGVVGGIAAIALIAAAIFFFLRKKTRRNNAAPGAGGALAPPTYAPPQDSNNTAYAAAAVGKPATSPHETQLVGSYAPVQNQGYQSIPQQSPQDMQEQHHSVPQQYTPVAQQKQQYAPNTYQQPHYPPMAEVDGNSYPQPSQNLAPGYGQAPNHSPGQTYYTPSAPGQISPNSQSHLSPAFPDRSDTTSPVSDHRVSQIAASEAPSSPAPTFTSHTPQTQSLAPVVEGRHEIGSNPARSFPSNLHDGTYEVPGSVPHHA